MRNMASEIKGKNVLVLNDALEIVQNVPASKLGSVGAKDAFVLMVGNATGSIVESAGKLKSKAVAAKTFGKISETDVQLVSL